MILNPEEEVGPGIKFVSLGYHRDRLYHGHYQFITKRWSGYYEDANGRFYVKERKSK